MAKLQVRRLTELDAAFAGFYALLIVCHLVAAWLRTGWPGAVLTDALACLYLLALAVRLLWRPLLLRLLTLGLVAGVCELATDAAGEGVAHSLNYPAGEPVLWASPFYMPVSWMVVLALLGYLGWRLRTLAPRPPIWLSAIICGLVGMATVPFYEEMAYRAGWWRYVPARNIGHTPLYVLFFEGAIAALLPLITGALLRKPLRHAAFLGLVAGAWMPVAAFIAWFFLGR